MSTTCIICFKTWTMVKEEKLLGKQDVQEKREGNRNKFLLNNFFKYFKVLLPLKQTTGQNQNIEWDLSCETLPFCHECKKTATRLIVLDRQFKQVQEALKETEELVKLKIQDSRLLEQQEIDAADKDVRVKILRDLISLPCIRLNRMKERDLQNYNRTCINNEQINVKLEASSPHHSYDEEMSFDATDDCDLDYSFLVQGAKAEEGNLWSSRKPTATTTTVEGTFPNEDDDDFSNDSVEYFPPEFSYAEELQQSLWGKRRRKLQERNVKKAKTSFKNQNKKKQINQKEKNKLTKNNIKSKTVQLKRSAKTKASPPAAEDNSVELLHVDDDTNDDNDDGEFALRSSTKRTRTPRGKSKKYKDYDSDSGEIEQLSSGDIDEEFHNEDYAERNRGEERGGAEEGDSDYDDDDDDDDDYADDPRDKDFLLPDDALATMQDDTRLQKKLEQRLKKKAREMDKNYKPTKKKFNSAKKLEDGSYDYCGFKFTGSPAEGYLCSLCPTVKSVCKRLGGIYQHIRHQHMDNGQQNICHICNKFLANGSSLRKHLQTHEERQGIICEICGGSYTDEKGLEIHMSLVHFPEFKFVCSTCGKVFKHVTHMKNHERRVHQKEKRLFCADCGKGFFNSGALVVHSASHSNERPFECAHCHQKFRRDSHRRRHIKQFHDLKPTDNSLQRKKLKTSTNYAQLSSSLPEDTDQALDPVMLSLRCKYCGLQYNRQNNLTRHLLQIHNIDVKGLAWKCRKPSLIPRITTTTAPIASTTTATTTTTTTTTTGTTSNPTNDERESIKRKKKKNDDLSTMDINNEELPSSSCANSNVGEGESLDDTIDNIPIPLQHGNLQLAPQWPMNPFHAPLFGQLANQRSNYPYYGNSTPSQSSISPPQRMDSSSTNNTNY